MTHEPKPFSVLVVDDNPLDQQLAAASISRAWPFEHELEIHLASDGSEALAMISTKRFTLIVLDWALPVMGNGEVLLQLRHHGVRIPVVILSSSTRAEIKMDLEKLQAAYLNKSEITPDTFWRAIGCALTLLGITAPTKQSLLSTQRASSDVHQTFEIQSALGHSQEMRL